MSSSSAASASTANKNNQNEQPTLVSLYDVDDLSAHHCGYCNQNGNISIGMSSELMRIEDYQTLIDRGWRRLLFYLIIVKFLYFLAIYFFRSGTYIYKPVMDKTCCPLYTIKCDAINFRLRKSQKNLIKSFNNFLYTNESNKKRKLAEKTSINRKQSLKTDESKNKSVSSNQVQIVAKMNNRNTSNMNDNNLVTIANRIKNYFASYLIDFNDSIKSPNELMNIDKKLKSKHKRLFKKLKKLKEKGLINDMQCKLSII
jgi:arginyl-tRNA--protein-N-Asp/Glu arginylyltransferase